MFSRLALEEKGLALPLVMILILVVSLLGISALFLVESQTTMGSQYTGSVQTIHYAEAGIHKYLWYLNKEGAIQPLFDTDIPFEDGFFCLSLVAQEEGYQVIRSTGWRSDRESTRRTIEAVLTKRTFCRQVYLSENDGTNIWWVDGDKCYGPYHTNSSLRVKGRPVFYGKVTYVNSIVPYDENTKADFREGTEQVTPLQFPSSNNQLKLLAESAGHLYEGRTSIYLKGDKYDVHYYDSQAKSFVKETEKEFPSNGVIYVNGGSSSQKFNSKSGNAFVSGTLQGRLTIAAANNIYITGRDPTEFNYSQAEVNPSGGVTYANTTFSPYPASGEQTGYLAEGDDMLGLVANNYIHILGNGWFSGNPSNVAPENVAIHGALFSITKGFGYESYDTYTKGIITLRGSLIQKTREPVGQFDFWGDTGYDKDYAHDSRMLYSSPPHFLEPQNTGWELTGWKEIQ